jgi:hypothetical protein
MFALQKFILTTPTPLNTQSKRDGEHFFQFSHFGTHQDPENEEDKITVCGFFKLLLLC